MNQGHRREPAVAEGKGPGPAADYPPIESYAILGNCRTGALVGLDGGIDWLCLPRFDSPSIFAALLDREQGGCFRIGPAGPAEVTRRYIESSAVLETTFRTESGELRLIDLMPVAGEALKRKTLYPEHELLRFAECRAGEVELDIRCRPRPHYGRLAVRFRDRGALGYFALFDNQVLILRAERGLEIVDHGAELRGRIRLRAKERLAFSLAFGREAPMVLPLLGGSANARLEETLAWWRGWTGRCRYDGPYRDMVLRSAVTLKLLTYAPSGAVVAALTTSLPERIGGNRNWDYRFCWLRDASAALGALFELGYEQEGQAFFSWLLHTTALTRPRLQVLYDVHGRNRIPERELPHLAGYAGSRPVRAGNAAYHQLQLDIYGEMAAAAITFVLEDHKIDPREAVILKGYGDVVCRLWREPDEGIWESRSLRRHHTFSKVMCWAALDRLLKLHQAGHIRVDVERYAREREAIRRAVEERGYRTDLGSYTAVFDGDEMDASLLLLGHYGYIDMRDDRFRSTFRLIWERLGTDGLLRRYGHGYDDGLKPGEGAFAICSFWAVECLAGMGRRDEADALFRKLLGFANDVGLYGEEIDLRTGAALGNFPQAYTHLGLINAALALAGRDRAARDTGGRTAGAGTDGKGRSEKPRKKDARTEAE